MTTPQLFTTLVLANLLLGGLAFAVACLCWLINFCFAKGNILRGYFTRLHYLLQYAPRRRWARVLSDSPQPLDELRKHTTPDGRKWQFVRSIDRHLPTGDELPFFTDSDLPAGPRYFHLYTAAPRARQWFFKPLGGCVYCYSIHVANLFFLPVLWLAGPAALIVLPLLWGLVYFFVSLTANLLK
jgi:hypothetical protein